MRETMAAKAVKPGSASGSDLSPRRTVSSVLVHLVVIGAAVLIGFPFFYMLSTSLKTVKEVYTIPMVILPAQPQWRNFVEVWNRSFGRLRSTAWSIRSVSPSARIVGLGGCFARLRFPEGPDLSDAY